MLIDTLLVLLASSVVFAVLMAAGVLDLGLSQTASVDDIVSASRAAPGWLMPVEYALVFAYFTVFELFGTTPGKRIFRMSVLREDGTHASPVAVVVRNVVRIPEMYLLYIPSAVSCLVSPRRKRLGDYAARTVVVRVVTVPAGTRQGPAAGARPGVGPAVTPSPFPPPGPVPPPPPPPAAAPAAGPATGLSAPAAVTPSLDDALAGLKTAALAVRGAHLSYLRFSEIELEREAARERARRPATGIKTAAGPALEAGGTDPTADPAPEPDDRAADANAGGDEQAYSREYAAAWYTLADAALGYQRATSAARAAATRAGLSLDDACGGQPDLSYLLHGIGPYLTAGSDEEIHAACLAVARAESAG